MTAAYKTTIEVEVLSEFPIMGWTLEDIVYAGIDGELVITHKSNTKVLRGKEIVYALYEAGSEPGFFMLDDEGNRVED